jgi:integrase
MPRPRRDGTAADTAAKCKFTEIFIQKLAPRSRAFLVWDTYQRGLAVQVQPTGHKAWKCIYSLNGRSRWYSIGDVAAIGLANARKLTADIMYRVAQGADPCADRRAERGKGTFEEIAVRYVEEYSKKHNRSWKQAEALVRKHLLPRWSKLKVTSITRQDVKGAIGRIEAPVVANQTLAAASAVLNWAVREEIITSNPCALVERNPTKSRERVLSDGELPQCWRAFDEAGLYKSTALKMILLTGQRPGEVRHMRREHIVDGWWEMPGDPDAAVNWPGTKNGQSHRVWLPASAKALLAELPEDQPQLFLAVQLDGAMRAICAKLAEQTKELGLAAPERVTPHDLRRTHGTTITGLGFGRDAMNRIQNHVEGGIATVYDRHRYSEENKRIIEAVADKIMSLVENAGVIPFRLMA